LRYEVFGSRLGVPGLNLPIGEATRLPVGLELEGLPGGDERLLALGIAIETIFGPLPPPGL
jgi:mandelamide amidase